MTTEYWISQAFVIVAIISCILSYFTKNRTLILIYRIIICASYTASYFFLGATAGAYSNIVSIVRTVVFFIYARRDRECPVWLFIIFELGVVAVSVVTWDNYFTLVVMFAHLLDAYTVWQKDVKIYRWVSVPVSILFMVYNFVVKSYLSVLLEGIVLIVKIISIIDYYSDLKNEKQNADK